MSRRNQNMPSQQAPLPSGLLSNKVTANSDTDSVAPSSSCAPSSLATNKPARSQCVRGQMSKTKYCRFFAQQGACPYGDGCAFAHSNAELHEAPDLAKTRLCRNFRAGFCNSLNCPFAHGPDELRATTHCFKKTLCRWHAKGLCKVGDQCRFAHGFEELPGKESAISVAHGNQMNEAVAREEIRSKEGKPKSKSGASMTSTTSASGSSESAIATPPSSVNPPSTATASSGGPPSGCCSSPGGTSRRYISSSSGGSNSNSVGSGTSGGKSHETPQRSTRNVHLATRDPLFVRVEEDRVIDRERRHNQQRAARNMQGRQDEDGPSMSAEEVSAISDLPFDKGVETLKRSVDYVVQRAEHLQALLQSVTTSIAQQQQVMETLQEQQYEQQQKQQVHEEQVQQQLQHALKPTSTLDNCVMTSLAANMSALCEQVGRLESRLDSCMGEGNQGGKGAAPFRNNQAWGNGNQGMHPYQLGAALQQCIAQQLHQEQQQQGHPSPQILSLAEISPSSQGLQNYVGPRLDMADVRR